MYRLKKDNIIREVESKPQKAVLEAAGFELIEDEEDKENKTSSKKGAKKADDKEDAANKSDEGKE